MYTAQLQEKLALAMERKIRECRQKADRRERLQNRMDRKLSEAANSMKVYAAKLEQRSPLARLSAGYGYISSRDGKAILTAEAVRRGDILNIRLKDGKVEAEALRVLKDSE
jgi:exodeoxyribonuclease VII large subunit